LGVHGVGKAEAKAATGAIDWQKKTISFTRIKTGKSYEVPIYPWADDFIRTELNRV
jgi:hypothetical protein